MPTGKPSVKCEREVVAGRGDVHSGANVRERDVCDGIVEIVRPSAGKSGDCRERVQAGVAGERGDGDTVEARRRTAHRANSRPFISRCENTHCARHAQYRVNGDGLKIRAGRFTKAPTTIDDVGSDSIHAGEQRLRVAVEETRIRDLEAADVIFRGSAIPLRRDGRGPERGLRRDAVLKRVETVSIDGLADHRRVPVELPQRSARDRRVAQQRSNLRERLVAVPDVSCFDVGNDGVRTEVTLVVVEVSPDGRIDVEPVENARAGIAPDKRESRSRRKKERSKQAEASFTKCGDV